MFHSIIYMTKNPYIHILILLIVFDFLTGYSKAILWKVADSWVGLKGIIKHIFTLLVYFFIGAFFHFSNSFGIGQLILVVMCLNYVMSILENLAVMGVFVPEFLKSKVQQEIKKYNNILGDSDDKKR